MWQFWVLLLLSVGIIGGVIAWLGDTVGRRIGRKHVRIFGLRPKTTGLVFAIGSGVLVALATVGTVSLLARSTVDNALKAPEMQLELEQLKQNTKKINTEYQESKAKLLKVLDQSKFEKEEFDRVRIELDAKQTELTEISKLNGRLTTVINSLSGERNTLSSQIKTRTAELQRLGRESSTRITKLRQELRLLEAQRLTFTGNVQRLNTQRDQLQQRITTLTTERKELETKFTDAQTATNQALAKQQNLESTVASLEADRKKLEAQQTQLEAQRNQLQAERNSLSASVTQLDGQSAILRNERTKLEGDIRELNQTRASLEASVNRLEAQNNTLTEQLNKAEQALQDSQAALADATSGNFIFRQGDLISQKVLESNSPDVLRTQLQVWLKQAAQVAQARGATRSKAVSLKPSADLEPYISQVLKTKGADLVLMRTSRSVTQTGIELPVTLEVRANETLFTSGQPLVSRELSVGQINASRPNSSWRVAIENLLRETQRDLIERGVPRENIPTQLVSAAEQNMFLAQLESLSGTVWIAVAARRDIVPSGPVQVYLSVMR